ncbi:MAG: cell division protein ZapA [Gammaproteobacteria bacterium]|nr:MAG: cell division protein ZapA [Gammaproteobacteria bacterium]
MSRQENDFVILKLMDKEFKVTCSEEEREGLLESAAYLNRKLNDLRKRGKVIGPDRVAITAALNISHELYQCRQALEELSSSRAKEGNGDLRVLRQRIEAVLDCAGGQNEINLS